MVASWVRDLRDADATCGNKAVALAQLLAAGLPVPAGFAIDARAFASASGELVVDGPGDVGHVLAAAAERIEQAVLSADLFAEVDRRARQLGALVVRSSSALEDRVAGSAPGVFASVVDVAPDEVWSAIRAVWTSALTPLAAAYGKHRAPAIGVIVQRFVAGTRFVVYTRPAGSPDGDELWIQRGEQLTKRSRSAPASTVDAGIDELARLALAAEQAIGAARGADVELVVGDERAWIVQARPIVHPVRTRGEPPPMVLAPLVADGRTWTLDIAHNPEPLSVAQVGLVERVERAGFAPWSMRVCAGYLYTTPASTREPTPSIASVGELAARASAIETNIARVVDGSPSSLDDALDRYLAFYRIWACELVPLIAAARAGLSSDQLPGARPSAVEMTLIAAARGELDRQAVHDRLGVLSPAWDVAVPTFAEQPAALDDAVERMRLALDVLGSSARPATHEHGPSIARAGADLAERDDAWFARAQWLVRRAILDRAMSLGWPTDDAFWIPLDDVIAGTLDVETVRRRAGAARAAADRARRWSMPIVVGGSQSDAPATSAASHVEPLRGVGSGGSVRGRVVRIGSHAGSPTRIRVDRGDVVVVRAVTPALAVVLAGCGALVSETGGLLDHGAAMARELGIPCVVGCRDAWSILVDDQLVTVDGERGIVTYDSPSSSSS